MIALVLLFLTSLSSALAQCLAVDGEWIKASDVAELNPRFAALDPDLRLLRSPFPGARRVVSPASLPPLEGEPVVVQSPFCVERRLRVLSREALDEALKTTLLIKDEPEIGFELLDYDRSMLPSGRLEFLVQSLPPPILGRTDEAVLWRGRLVYAEGRSVPFWARVRLWIEGDVCVWARDVARGEDIKVEDCRIGKKRYPPFVPPPLRDASALERTTASRKLKAEEPIYQALLVRKPEVEAGKPVELKVVNGGAQLRFQAKAASSGRRGDSVAVTNPVNGKRLEGRVVGQGSVEVRLK